MYKIINLGNEFSSTGEPRARILDRTLVKVASSEIQEYWDKLERNDKYAYLWVIGVSAMEYYGCNNNGDAFAEADLKKTIPDWAKNAHIFVHHVNKDPRKSIGKPIYAWYNDDMHRVELILAIDRNANGASSIVERITNGEQMYVSMGCNVAYDVCSICGHQSKTRAEYCDHLRYNMKRILQDGRQVYAFNPNPRFFDISIVTKPADPTAFALDKLASVGLVHEPEQGTETTEIEKTSAELGEESEDLMLKAAAVRKLADIIKQVNGEIVDTKIDPSIQRVRDIAETGFQDFDYPVMPYKALESIGTSPFGLLAALSSCGAPMSLADAYWMSGLHRHGCGMYDALSMLPQALSVLEDQPELFSSSLRPLFSSAPDWDDPLKKTLTIRVVRPVAIRRIEIIRRIPLSKEAEFGKPDVPAKESNFAPMIVSDAYGHTMRTNPYYLNQSKWANRGFRALRGGVGALLLAMAALGGYMLLPKKDMSLAKRVGIPLAAAVPGAALLFGDLPLSRQKFVDQRTQQEIPAELILQSWKQPITKTAVSAADIGGVVGMATPAALALDYSFNKQNSQPTGLRYQAGKMADENIIPAAFLTGLAGVGAGKGLAAGARNVMSKFRKA